MSSPCIGGNREGRKEEGCSQIMHKTKHSVSSYSLPFASACLLAWFSFVLRGGVFRVRVVMFFVCELLCLFVAWFLGGEGGEGSVCCDV